MVYVYATQNELNSHIGEKLSIKEIEETLIDMGMDLKGISNNINPELKIELTAEKLDLISAIGIARAIKYYRGIENKLPKYNILKSNLKLNVEESTNKVRGKIVAAIIKDIPMSQELLNEIIKIQEKIHDSFGRHRKKAAIGIYPLEKIEFPIKYKAENPENIIFKPLECENEIDANKILKEHETGKKFAHLLKNFKLYPVIRDNKNKILSMPPIINSENTGRVEINNKNLFIECTGHNINHIDNILKVLVSTFIEYGAKAESIEVIYENKEKYELSLENSIDKISLKFINKKIGININIDELKKLLPKMMYELKEINGDEITILIPPFKSDVWSSVDIADDIARAYGYNNITPTFPEIPGNGSVLKISRFKDKITEQLTNLGFLEIYSYMLSSSTLHFDNMTLNSDKENFIKLIDSEDQGINMIRTTILPDNLESLRINRKNKYPQKIFENGWTIQPDKSYETGARNEAHLSVSIADPKSNYTLIKEVLDTISKLNSFEFKLKESNKKYLINGRGADIYLNSELVGFIGELNPQILENFSLLIPVSSLELNLEKIFNILNN